MVVCKNRTSGQYFIYVNEAGPGEILLITPTAKVKSLQNNLFTDLEENTEEQLLISRMVSPEQIRSFNEYKKNRAEDETDDFVEYFAQLSPGEQVRCVQRLRQALEENGSITQA